MDVPDMRADLLSVLRGAEAGTLLRQALGASGVSLRSWTLEQLYARPGAELSATYRVRCEAPAADRPTGAPETGQLTTLTMVASTVALTPTQRGSMGAVRADSSHGTVHLWVHPVDPELPGLGVVERATASAAEDPDSTGLPGDTELESRLSRLLGEPCRLQSLQVLVLRPLRRAVYRAVVSSTRGRRVVYLKVVRPARAAQLLQRHGCSPLIPAIADAGDGILVLDAAAGLPLTHHLYRSTAPADVGRIEPSVLLAALETLRPEAVSMPPRVAPAQRLSGLTEAAITAGADPLRVQRLGERIAAALSEAPGPIVPTHGDFHPANLFLDQTGRRPTGLIDADTAGPGFRADDFATMLGHLLALPSFDAEGYAAAPEFAQRFHTRCILQTDPSDLGARTAAVLLSLLPGALDVKQREHHLREAEKLVQAPRPTDPM